MALHPKWNTTQNNQAIDIHLNCTGILLSSTRQNTALHTKVELSKQGRLTKTNDIGKFIAASYAITSPTPGEIFGSGYYTFRAKSPYRRFMFAGI